MKTYVVTVIYYEAQPIAMEIEADSRSEALRQAWMTYEQVSDHVKKIVAVLK